jgi:Flp pilus assembly protein TadD
VGSIARIENHYLVDLKAMECQSGDTLASAEDEATSREHVIGSVERVANELRRKLGESQESLRKFNQPLEQATTSSLEALQAYTQGIRTNIEKGDAESLPYLKRAVELDPYFARAYAQIGIASQNLNQARAGIENLTKAYELRNRTSERERLFIEATYYTYVTGELEKASQSYTQAVQTYPRDDLMRNASSINESILGQYGRALTEVRESLGLMPTSYSYSNLVSYCVPLNRLDEAKSAFEQAIAHDFDGPFLRLARYDVAFLEDDTSAMQEQVSWANGKPGAEDMLMSAQSDTEAYHGRLRRARQFSEAAARSASRIDAKEAASLWHENATLREVEFGNFEFARNEYIPSDQAGRDVNILAALSLARAGQSVPTQKLIHWLNVHFPKDTMVQNYWIPTISGELKLVHKRPNDAIRLLEVASLYELGQPYPFNYLGTMYPAYVRGKAYLYAGDAGSATVEFRKILDHRGVTVNFWTGALAHLQLGRAYAMQGENAKARIAYRDFLTLWKDADPDIPILKQAKAEYAKLQ